MVDELRTTPLDRPIPSKAQAVFGSSKPLILLGVGLGGMFDGILLHQLLQWHHMLSHSIATTTLKQLKLMIWADGLFHASTYLLLLVSGIWIWRILLQQRFAWNTLHLIGGVFSGWGLFNLIEGVINHYLLAIHHVNETVAADQWYLWDAGFLGWGLLMLIGGNICLRKANQQAIR